MILKSTSALDKLNKLALLGTTALIASFGVMSPAYAQDSASTTIEDDLDEVVATGIRQSLKDARDLKRNADTAIDSITASDVGQLPDLSVAEALARVPGVVVQRFDITSNNGGDFPSPEGGGNLIRGLTLVRSEFNGRDSFSANGGRALDFGTIPPELIGAVDVYKNSTADLIEGGIGGTINLRTLEPFDRDGVIGVVSVDGTYTDLRDEWAPDVSVLLGNRWDTGAGEFGLLGSLSHSELKSDLHGFQIGQVVPFNTPAGDTIALPGGFQLRTNDVDRERDSYYLAGQWRNNDGSLQVTGKYSRIENFTDSNERTVEFFPDGESFNQFEISPSFLDGDFTTSPFESSGLPQCQGGNEAFPGACEITVPVSGILDQGIVSNNLRDWTGAGGAPFTNLGINQIDNSSTEDISLNIKWRPSDRLFVSLDGHRTTADFSRERLWAGSRFFSDFTLNADLDNPQVSLISQPGSNPFTRSGTSTTGTGSNSDPNNAYLLFAADEFQDNEGELIAFRGDVEYEFESDGWFDKVKFGARIADRDQTNRAAGLNWAAVAPPWAGGGYLPYAGLQNSQFELVDFSGFQRGGVVQGTNTEVIFPDRNLIRDYDAFVSFINGEPLITDPDAGRNPDWTPLRGTDGVVDYDGRGQIGTINEKTQNYYARLDFGNEFNNGMSLEGNVGIRYTNTDVSAVGQVITNSLLSLDAQNGGALTENDERLLNFVPEAVAYSQQADVDVDGNIGSDDRWLPSLNLKLNVNDNFLVRFAASEAITRPNIAQLRTDQSTNVGLQFLVDQDIAAADPTADAVVGIRPTIVNIYGGNPDLQPIESTNLDLSFESYFGDNNSLTLSLFHKDLRSNIIYASETLETVTLDGEQVAVVFNGDLNQDEAKIKGLEIAYQQFYDELPGLFGNLGLQANYTYIDAKTNAPEPNVAEGDPNFNFERIYRFGVEDFLGLSDHTANIIGIYQDDKLEMRLAYNWRSEYLSSYRDFVTGNPIYQQATGYLDGSIKYDFTEQFQVRAQIANITNERANAEQQIDASGQRFGRTSFIGDRRIKIGARYQF